MSNWDKDQTDRLTDHIEAARMTKIKLSDAEIVAKALRLQPARGVDTIQNHLRDVADEIERLIREREQ